MEEVRRLSRDRRRAKARPDPTPPAERPQAAAGGAANPGRPRDVQVIYGAGTQTFPLAGQRVGNAWRLLANILQVDPQATVLVNGRPVCIDYTLRPGDRLEMVHHSGEKG